MFGDYYYTEEFPELIYFSMLPWQDSTEISLYVGDEIVRRQTVGRGSHQLVKDDIVLNVKINWLKTVPELRIEDRVIEIKKVKRSQLAAKLEQLGINNEINPKILPAEPYNFRKLMLPLLFVLIGTVWQIFTIGKGKFWDVPAMLLFFIAYYQLFGDLINKVSERFMDANMKSTFKIVLAGGTMILSLVLISKILN